MSLAKFAKIGIEAHHNRLREKAQAKKRQHQKTERENPYRHYADDPAGFVLEVCGADLTDEQVEICNSLRDRETTIVQAAHGVGKTFLSARLVLWYIMAAEGVVVTTAPTNRQVRELLWKEIKRERRQQNFGGRIVESPYLKLTIVEDECYAYGFSTEDRNQNAFQGIHEEKLLIVVDEACGITSEIWDGAMSCLTGGRNRLLAVGNPVQTDTPFQQECARGHIRIPVWSHPNVCWAYDRHPDGIHRLKPAVARLILNKEGKVKPQDEWPDDPLLQKDTIPGAVSVNWIENTARPYGETSSYWVSRVEAQFPLDAENSLVPRSWFREARHRYDSNVEYYENLASVRPWRAALDIGDGADPHALAGWKGPVLYLVKEYPTQGDRLDTTRAAGMGIRWLAEKGGRLSVDATGVGAGTDGMILQAINEGLTPPNIASAVDGLPEKLNLKDCVCTGVKWSEKAAPGGYEPDRFRGAGGLKNQQCFALRKAFEKGEIAIAPLGDLESRLEDELCGIYWEERSDGDVRIEPKSKTRKRLKRSPNLADATIMAYSDNAELLTADLFDVGSITRKTYV